MDREPENSRPPHRDGHVVAVLPDEETVAAARQRLGDAGVDLSRVQIGGQTGHIASVRAEMRSEVEQALISPQLGVAWPKEGLKGVTAVALVASVVVTLIALPILLLVAPQWPVVLNALLAAAIGVVAGGTIGVVGGAAATRGPAEPLGAEAGVTVRVPSTSTEVIRILESLDPIRVDVVLPDGSPTGEAVREEPDRSLELQAERMAHQTDTDWNDRDEQREATRRGEVPHE